MKVMADRTACAGGRRATSRAARASFWTLLIVAPATAAQAQPDAQAVPPKHARHAGPSRAPSAQSAAPESIVVTAQRRSQRLQDVPASIVAVSGATLTKRSIVSINDLSAVVANLQIADPFGPGSPPAFTIRGISSTDFSQNQSRPIAVYVDEGIRQLPAFEAMPLFDIDHVEVLRGPQGALYGKDATGGAVNIITAKPGFDTAGYLQAGYGNYNRRETEGAVQTALVPDKVALRLAYTYINDDGVTQNLYPRGRNSDQTDIFGFRASLLVRPNDDVDVLLRASHFESQGRNQGVYADNIDFADAGFPELAGIPGNSRAGLGFFQVRQNYQGRRDIRDDGFNLQVNWHLSDIFTLTSITTFDAGKWDETVDADGLPIDQERDVDNADNQRQIVQELRLIGKIDRLRILFGGFYSADQTDVFLRYNYFIDPRCTVSCSSAVLDGFNDGSRGEILTNSFTQRRTSYSGYGRLEYNLTDTVAVSAGLRASHDRVAVSTYTAYLGDVANPVAEQTIAPTSRAQDFSNVSAEAGVTWKPVRNLTTYATFKQGYRTGAVNGQAFDNASEINFVQPETADSWEVGVKSQPFGRLLTANAAGFYALYQNQQIISAEQVNGGTIYPLRSVPASRIYGAETDLVLRPNDDLTLTTALGYTNAIYTKGIVDGSSVAGNPLTNSAKWSGNASAEWNAARIGDGTVVLRADESFQTKVYFDVHKTPTTVDPGHVVTGASVAFDKPRWTLTAWATNLFDTHYFTYALDTSSEGFVYKTRAVPREFGVRLRYRF